MRDVPNDPWFGCLPSCEAQVPCSGGWHTVRWEAGQLRLPEHPDAEAELVLAALGGEKAGCVRLAEAWGRHTRDLSVLAIGPRGPADEIAIGWEDVQEAAQANLRGFAPAVTPAVTPPAVTPPAVTPPAVTPPTVTPPAAPGQLASPPALAGLRARQQQAQRDALRAQVRRNDMLSLLALGYGFQVRLAGQVAAAHADAPDEIARPALVAAIAGRLAPVAEAWLGIDPDQLVVSLHHGPGWGQSELTGHGDERRLRVHLPVGWLSRVWACGLALAGGRLVVAVERAGWPRARVLALRAPGAEPVPLEVHARGADRDSGPTGAPDAPHWEV